MSPRAMDEPLEIRRQEPEDAEALQAIHRQESSYSPTLQLPYPSVQQWKERLANPTWGHHGLVAVLEGELVGHIGLGICREPGRGHAAELGMVIKEEHRGQGIGSRLMSEALELAEGWLGVRRIELSVYVDNAAAIALYEKFGFCSEGIARCDALRGGEYVDTLHMARHRPARRVRLRPATEVDLPTLYEHQRDPQARRLAAIQPCGWDEFRDRWIARLEDPSATVSIILVGGEIAGSVLSFPEDERLMFGYWISRRFWGQGITSRAVERFLPEVSQRPLHASVSAQNKASIRILEKFGFSPSERLRPQGPTSSSAGSEGDSSDETEDLLFVLT